MPAPLPLPFGGTLEAKQALAAENQAAWKLLDEHRLDPNRPASAGYRRITDYRVSMTDPDATPMNVHGESRLGYRNPERAKRSPDLGMVSSSEETNL